MKTQKHQSPISKLEKHRNINPQFPSRKIQKHGERKTQKHQSNKVNRKYEHKNINPIKSTENMNTKTSIPNIQIRKTQKHQSPISKQKNTKTLITNFQLGKTQKH
jgi:hypothetical protein